MRDDSERASASQPRRPYCLRCYAAMERFEGASLPCAACGYVNVKLDQELYWTREPRFVELEAYAKIVVVFGLVGLSALMLYAMSQKPSYGLGQGWAVAFPILVGIVLWDTASAITQRRSALRLAIVWRVVCALLAPWPLLFAVALNPWSRSDVPVALFAVLALVGLLLAAGALGLGALGRQAGRWREERVRAAQSRAPLAAPSS